MNNSYESLCAIYDRADARIKATLPATIKPDHKVRLRPPIRSLSENVAVVVLNYTSQVLNGGHQQYTDNGYLASDHQDLLAVLTMIGGPYSLKVIENVNAVLKVTGDELCMPDMEDEGDYDDPFDEIDSKFYKYDKEFCDEVYAWIRSTEVATVKALMSADGVSPL
jgi:hypothetical protein